MNHNASVFPRYPGIDDRGSRIARFARAVADEAALARALEEADIVPQLLLQAHLSGDTDLLSEAAGYISGGWSFMETLPAALRAKSRPV